MGLLLKERIYSLEANSLLYMLGIDPFRKKVSLPRETNRKSLISLRENGEKKKEKKTWQYKKDKENMAVYTYTM